MVDCRLKRNKNLSVCKRNNPSGKLKCWRKINENKWTRKNDSIRIITEFNKQRKITGYETDIYIFETQNKDSYHIIKPFKTKPQAESFAKDYMRKHDIC